LGAEMKKLMVLFLFALTSKFVWGNIYGSISGKVVAEDTKKGLKGAYVYLWSIDISEKVQGEPFTVVSDQYGNFVFTELKNGVCFLSCRPKPPYYGEDLFPNRFNKGIKINLEKGKSITDVTIIVKIGASLSGRVYDAEGIGISGVSVTLRCQGLEVTETDSNGYYKIESINPSNENELEASIATGGLFKSNSYYKSNISLILVVLLVKTI
jgi:hypothetical protein